MGRRPGLLQILWAALAVAGFVAAGLLQRPLDSRVEQRGRRAGSSVVAQRHPELALLTMAPGGLRAPVVNALWIRAQNLKDEGRYYDAMQLADAICRLQPEFAGVWGFHAWNMAWNISAATHTREERWRWVSNGISLLRDQGIQMNPDAVVLYKELGWIFFSKMGMTLDEMHLSYKRRWAAQMQHLLGSPRPGTTAETIDWFRPVAEAPLDTDPRRQAESRIQPDQRRVLLEDGEVASYSERLDEVGLSIGEDFLDAYNRFSRHPSVDLVRVRPPRLRNEQERAIYETINAEEYEAARQKILAFIRAQLLWNVYRMDPDWMLQLMERYGPLDWRLVWPHGLYWVTYGLHVTESLGLNDIDSLNTDRIVLNCLKQLTWHGRMTYVENPDNPDEPYIAFWSDTRFIRPTQEEHERIIEAVIETTGEEFKDNTFRPGHINYLIQAIQTLVAGRNVNRAQQYLDYIRDEYEMTGDRWDLQDVEDFVLYELATEETPTLDMTVSQISISLQTGFVALAADDSQQYRDSMQWARRVFNRFQQSEAAERVKQQVPSLGEMAENVAASLLIEPRTVGYNLTLPARARLYGSLPERMRLAIYDRIAPYLRSQCRQQGIDFQRAFPAPGGLEEYRSRRGQPLGDRQQ
ncbi:MAG: hypothetical protein ACLFVW_01385 [Phycisphaerae bacterium]